MTASAAGYRHPDFLIDTAELEARLGDADLRLYDCTTHLLPHPTLPYTVESGRADYDRGHVPGADFLDLQGELSDSDSQYRFTFPDAGRFADAVGRRGLGDDASVVLYSTTSPQWATRVWWMLRAFGFDRARVLDGGFTKWAREGRAVSTEPASYSPAIFTPRPREGLIVGRDEVLSAVGNGTVCTVNALAREQHAGTGGGGAGRAGLRPGRAHCRQRERADRGTA